MIAQLRGFKDLNIDLNSLRDAIAKYPANWVDCEMWVEDIVSPEVNITADISNEDANNFIKLCQMFSCHVPNLNEGISTKKSIHGIVNLNQRAEISRLIEMEIATMSQPLFLESRRRSEVALTAILTDYIYKFDAALEIHVFGSSFYGIKGTNTNFNLLINTRMC